MRLNLFWLALHSALVGANLFAIATGGGLLNGFAAALCAVSAFAYAYLCVEPA